jgi:bifunctional non-homologous end joining protein LigD
MSSVDQRLERYQSMRSPEKTPEPFGGDVDPEKLFFVVQKHKATTLHYDFRLEVDGVMASWSIPKGPTLDSTVKRLAIRTEDHPLDYRHFEGIIPEGEYGAGKVMIWDQGTFVPEVEVEKGVREEVQGKEEGQAVLREGLEKGEIKLRLYGQKLEGSFALIRTHGIPGKESWLLIKHKDRFVDVGWDPNNYDVSAVSGRSIREIK